MRCPSTGWACLSVPGHQPRPQTCGPLDLSVERLDQDYARTADEGRYQRYDYAAPVFGFACRLVYDESGLVLDYPGIAVRAV